MLEKMLDVSPEIQSALKFKLEFTKDQVYCDSSLKGVLRDLSWNTLYANGLVIMAKTEDKLQQRLLEWQNCQVSKSLLINPRLCCVPNNPSM
jgi:hypothetical protein